jgi:hypothetical protein
MKAPLGLRLGRLCALFVLALAGSLVFSTASAWAATTVTTGVHTELTVTCEWTIDKSADPSELTLQIGQQATVTYTVTVDRSCEETAWRVFDGILISASGTPTTVNGVSDTVTQGTTTTAAAVSCPSAFPFTIPAGASVLCSYSANLASGAAGTNTAAVQTVAEGTVSSGATAFDFSSPETTNTVGGPPCVEVDDSFAGDLGFVCADDPLPATFTYPRTFGPFAQCGEQFFDNHAVLEIPGPGNVVIARAVHTLRVNVPCAGCALTIGYWKTHAGFGPQADAVTPLLPVWLGNPGGAKSILVDSAAEAVQFLSFRGSNNVFRPSNGINKLYAQLLGAKLNILSGADPSAVASVITAADNFLSNKNSTNWATLSAAKKALVLSWKNTLDAYNNGVIGPGHCTE